MNTATQKTNGKLYQSLLAHCQKQYKDIQVIEKAYMLNGQVFGIDYTSTSGQTKIACATYKADKVIYFN
jgi:hypothetical protein